MRKKILFLLISLAMGGLFCATFACADEFGILSETHLYPNGLRLDIDSKVQVWHNLSLSDDTTDKREGKKSLKGFVPDTCEWFGFGVIWDPDNDNLPEPKNMSAYATGSLKFWVKTNVPLKIGIEDTSTQKWFNISATSEWKFIALPFNNDINFSQVTQFFMVANTSLTPGTATFRFDNVRWDTKRVGPLANIIVYPPTWTIPTGLSKSFLAKGYDADGDNVDIYPTWSRSGVSGLFILDEGPLSIFRSTAVSSGTIQAAYGGLSGSASVAVADIIWNDFFNIFIDEGMYGGLGAYDSDYGNADGDGINNNSITLETVTNIYPPGHKKSLKATYSITSTGWAGLFFQEGEIGDIITERDVSIFQDGYLHLWVKTPVDLEVSMRSGNISTGSERSKAMLSDYNITLDNTWRRVYIALDDFKLRDNRLDLTQAKVFLNTALIGELISSLSGTFYLSDIRYVRRKEATPSLSVKIKNRSDNVVRSVINYSTAELRGGWKIADQYLEILYKTVDPSWAIQIYTDNMASSASPRYTGDPTKYLNQQPVGLIGEREPLLTCSMAYMIMDKINNYLPIPHEVDNGMPPNDPRFRIYFDSDWGTEEPKGEWLWLKDVNSTRWDNDTNNNSLAEPGEIVRDFSLTGDEYSTFITPAGIRAGWFNPDNTRVYILNPEPPIMIYLAAKFNRATVSQKYKSNAIMLELYHY